jgi:CMP/dCMP kinase
MVIGGPGGSGASTIARRLAKHFELEYVYAGQLMRDLAKEKGFSSLTEFLNSEYFKENSQKYDMQIDESLIKKISQKNVLIDSKIFAALATMNDIPCTVKIWINANLDTRTKRTLEKKGWDDEKYRKVHKRLKKRYAADKERFLKLHKIEFGNQEKYNDVVVDSSDQNPEETFNFILKFIKDGGYIKEK